MTKLQQTWTILSSSVTIVLKKFGNILHFISLYYPILFKQGIFLCKFSKHSLDSSKEYCFDNVKCPI